MTPDASQAVTVECLYARPETVFGTTVFHLSAIQTEILYPAACGHRRWAGVESSQIQWINGFPLWLKRPYIHSSSSCISHWVSTGDTSCLRRSRIAVLTGFGILREFLLWDMPHVVTRIFYLFWTCVKFSHISLDIFYTVNFVSGVRNCPFCYFYFLVCSFSTRFLFLAKYHYSNFVRGTRTLH